MNGKLLTVGILLLQALCGQVFGQNNGFNRQQIHQDLYWLRYHNRIFLSDKWEWQAHADDRRHFYPNVRHHFLFRAQPFFHISENVSLSQGFVYAMQHPHEPMNLSELAVPELRPFQEVVVKNDLGEWQIRHRYRLEERFFRRADDERLLAGYNFNWRVRYQLQLQRRLFKLNQSRGVHFRIAEEVMINMGRNVEYNVFDQSRFSAAFFVNLSDHFDLELGYSHWYQQLRDGESFFNRNIYRMTLYHNIDLRP
ncbi:DUF2490 domain-containing protein [Cytophagaceae bacterium ABcell3]|nr:DUF2490 domain-containing protein [Cytophagaceae bacterium ABcell3]